MADNAATAANQVAAAVCGKPDSMAIDECFTKQKRPIRVCQAAGKCRIREKTQDQLSYVLHSTSEHTFLKACPGAGKTEVVGLKMSYAIATRIWGPSGVATLTFTNNAAEVISDRVAQFTGHTGYPHFIGTIDAWLHRYILGPFGHTVMKYGGKNGDHSCRIVDNTSDAHFLNNYQTKYQHAQQGSVKANQCYFDPEGESGSWVFSSGQYAIDQKRNGTPVEDYFKDDLWTTKHKFWGDGFATHADVEVICGKLLNNNKLVGQLLSKRFPVIIVDECQDLSWIQMAVLDFLRQGGSTLHFVGDINQSIYRFKKVDPQAVLNFVQEQKFSPLALKHNFRCDDSIVRLCGSLVNQDSVTGENFGLAQPSCVFYTYKPDTVHESNTIFSNILLARGIALSDACIVTRGRSLLSRLRPTLKSSPSALKLQECLATAIQLAADSKAQVNNDALRCLGRFVARRFFEKSTTDPRHHYCPEEVESAMRWRLFLFQVLKSILDSDLADLTKTWAIWVSHVRSGLADILTQHIALLSDVDAPEVFPALTGNSFRCLQGMKDEVVADTLPCITSQHALIRATTIHDVKGETFDAILLVSSHDKRGDGTHWMQWLADKSSEHARFAYVASSRPRKLLAWAISENDLDDAKKALMPLGFTLHEPVS